MIHEDLESWVERAEANVDVDTQEVEAQVAHIRHVMRVDGEFFIEFFLAEQLDMPVPQFHKDVWSLLTDVEKERILLAIPRDHAKTTLAKLCVVWYWLHTRHRFAVYLSNTNAIAKGACKDIIGFIKHPNFEKVYGAAKMIKESENESLWIFELTLPGNGGQQIRKTCILRAIGCEQQMRGINIDNQRPDIAVIDDVEDNENTGSESQQLKVDKWIFGPFLKALARRRKIIWLGNMLSKTSLLARLSRMPKWNPVVFGALVKDTVTGLLQPLWPGKWSVEALKEDLAEYRLLGLVETWMCEMMNLPGHGINGFTADQINYAPQPTPDDLVAAWITVDPAFGQNAHNDETSIAVHGILKDGDCPMTVAVVHGKGDEMWMFNEILSLALYWNAWVWGIEAVAAQRVLISMFQLLLAGRMLNHSVEMVPLMSGRGDPKVSRIRSFVALMGEKQWAIPDSDVDITTQIVQYDMRKKEQPDDIIDSCAYGPTMMETYLPIIMAQASGEGLNGVDAVYGKRVAGI